ncbi:MAG: hypothetical protein M1817_005891 [Caeruleum heppii]|nr:MAG: hypothetical protein M1817_005891 [Caeruleum heppii]
MLLAVEPLTQKGFAQYGTVIENPELQEAANDTEAAYHGLPTETTATTVPVEANQGTALKYSNISGLVNRYDLAKSKRPAEPRMDLFICLPRGSRKTPAMPHDSDANLLRVPVLERHLYTSQTFIPLGLDSTTSSAPLWLVVVAPTLPAPGRASTAGLDSRSERTLGDMLSRRARPPAFPLGPEREIVYDQPLGKTQAQQKTLGDMLSQRARPPAFPLGPEREKIYKQPLGKTQTEQRTLGDILSQRARPPAFPLGPEREKVYERPLTKTQKLQRTLGAILSQRARPPAFPLGPEREKIYERPLSKAEAGSLEHGPPDLSRLRAFVGTGSQAVTYAPGTWHAPMIALDGVVKFVVLQYGNGVQRDECEELQLGTKEMEEVLIELPQAGQTSTSNVGGLKARL